MNPAGAAAAAGAAPGLPPASPATLARLLQFGDSMLPIGGFAFSGGLESAVQQRVVTDADSLLAYARTMLDQANRGDGIGIVAAHRAALAGDTDALWRIDAAVHARKLSGETRAMSVRMGRKFAELAAQVTLLPELEAWRASVAAGATPGCYPVALAVSFAAQGLSARDAFVVHHYGVTTMILSAALRLMRIGHVDTQRMTYVLNAGAEAAYQRAATCTLADMAGFAPLADILAAVHVRAHVRLFMN